MSEPLPSPVVELEVPIPKSWSAAEAMAVCDFLDTLLSAIWEIHGEAMAELIARQLRGHIAEQAYQAASNVLPDDDIPF